MAKKKQPTAAEIRRDAERLLRQQREVLAEAGSVLRSATHEASRAVHDDIYPRFAAGSRRLAGSARHRIVDEVLPGIASVIGSTMSAVDAARGGARSSLGRWGRYAPPPAPAPRRSVGKYVLFGLGIAVALGVGYVIYQTFRADDELWVEEDLD